MYSHVVAPRYLHEASLLELLDDRKKAAKSKLLELRARHQLPTCSDVVHADIGGFLGIAQLQLYDHAFERSATASRKKVAEEAACQAVIEAVDQGIS